jgi:hypothetical protein
MLAGSSSTGRWRNARVVRAFVEGITVDAASQSAERRMKRLPEPDLASTGSSFELVGGRIRTCDLLKAAPDSNCAHAAEPLVPIRS